MKIKSAKYYKPSPPHTGDDPIGIFLTLENDDSIYHVPISEDDRHYRAVLKWVAEGNTVAAAD